jgi:hypothetical protein
MEPLTDIEKDITLNPYWVANEIYRLLAWEILCSASKGKWGMPVEVEDLCDMIGASEAFYSKILYNVRHRLNEK